MSNDEAQYPPLSKHLGRQQALRCCPVPKPDSHTGSLPTQQQGPGSCCCALPCCRGVPPPRLLHLATAPAPGGAAGGPAAAASDGGGGSMGGLAARAKAVLPCRKCKRCTGCDWWARVGSAAGAEKYGTQYFALCIAIKVRRSAGMELQPLLSVSHFHVHCGGKCAVLELCAVQCRHYRAWHDVCKHGSW